MRGIVARDVELQAGAAFLRAVAEGSAALLLEGEAGIGKTTVWTEIADRAASAGYQVLRAMPAAAEASMTLSALSDLLEVVPETVLASLPRSQGRAIDAALLRAESAADALEQRLLGTAVRSVLLRLAADAPLVLAIDDVQWMDGASASTLAYALRRVEGARIGLLTARRQGMPAPLDAAGLFPDGASRQLQVGPVNLAALHHLLKGRLGDAPSRSTLVRVHEASGGNPLFALEIVRLLRDLGEPPANEPLPVPPDVRDLVRGRVRRLPSSTREVLLAVAAQGAVPPTAIAVALGREVEPDLERAVHEEIARLDGEKITFEHPLFAAAIYANASDAERREIHSRLAATVEGVEERARHLALATPEPNADVADELEGAARAAAARAAPLAAADLMALAIRSTPMEQALVIDARMVARGELLQRAGDMGQAERVLDEAVRTASTRHGRARARLALASVRYEQAADASSAILATEALGEAEGDAELVVHAHAMLAAVDYGDRQAARGHAREAKRLLDDLVDPDPRIESLVLYVAASADVHDGRPFPTAMVDRALALERVAPDSNVGERLSASLGFWLLLDDDLAGARRWMDTTYAAAVDEGDEGSIPYALSHIPTLELAAGDWPRAEAVARQHLAAAIELGQANQRLAALFSLASVLVHQGDEAASRPVLDELLRDAEAANSLWDVSKGLAALGALELALGDRARAVPHLLRADEGRDVLGDDAPRRHEADLVEALLGAGEVDRAGVVSTAMSDRARRYGQHSRLAVAARCRGLVAAATGKLDEAINDLDDALREHDLADLPFDRARTDLALGQVRRRRRERALAKTALDRALASFERLGARLWAERTRAELGRLGLRRGSGDGLSEGERRVAELVASGMTVREVAAAMFVSPKTVEAHLTRAYGKLGIRSRAELGAVMATNVGESPMRPGPGRT